MDRLYAEIGEYVVLPVLGAGIGLLWRWILKGPAGWTPEDRLLLSDFLVSTIVLQLTFMVPTSLAYLTGEQLAPGAGSVFRLQAYLVVALSGAFLGAVGSVRQHIESDTLTSEGADALSGMGACLLFLVFVFNGFVSGAVA